MFLYMDLFISENKFPLIFLHWVLSSLPKTYAYMLFISVYIYIYIYIYVYHHSSCCAASADIPDPLLPLLPINSLPLAGLQGYILCPQIADLCKFKLVVLLLLGHMWGSIGVHHLWARPCFSSSVLHVCGLSMSHGYLSMADFYSHL